MAKIVVDPGVYLPSNPDGVVVELDKKSGRPLQSHAKVSYLHDVSLINRGLTSMYILPGTFHGYVQSAKRADRRVCRPRLGVKRVRSGHRKDHAVRRLAASDLQGWRRLSSRRLGSSDHRHVQERLHERRADVVPVSVSGDGYGTWGKITLVFNLLTVSLSSVVCISVE